jgi:hypothetical protein
MNESAPEAPPQKFCPFMPPIVSPGIRPGDMAARPIPCLGAACAVYKSCQVSLPEMFSTFDTLVERILSEMGSRSRE